VFGFMEHSMNRLYVRSIGMARANGFVGLVNLTYNLFQVRTDNEVGEDKCAQLGLI
jgi:hypothetical protein